MRTAIVCNGDLLESWARECITTNLSCDTRVLRQLMIWLASFQFMVRVQISAIFAHPLYSISMDDNHLANDRVATTLDAPMHEFFTK